MLSVKDAQEQILQWFEPFETITTTLGDALGRTLSQEIRSNFDFPLFNNSSVDGFAIRWEDSANASAENPITLKVVIDIPAGNVSNDIISAGQAARIMTGAPIPSGADAVVMIEDTDASANEVGSAAPKTVRILAPLKFGENIRWRGADIHVNQEIIPAGSVLLPQHIGILAMLGVSAVPIRRKPKIALFSSGDELISVEEQLTPGKIYDSNTFMLAALLQNAGCDVITLGVASDQYAAVEEILNQAANTNPDLIVSSAGVSAGAFDYIRNVVESAGTLSLWKVNMRPGKPLAFGSFRDIPFFGLPGNPVASFVSFMVFIQPVLNKLIGKTLTPNVRIKVKIIDEIESDGRESYLRAVVSYVDGIATATLTGHQGSGNLFSMVQANALLIIPAGVKFCPKNSDLEAWML
jgi:molybdopterin molybdotransferase